MVQLQSGLLVATRGRAEVVNDLTIPSPDEGEVLIKVHAVGLNPSDWMALDGLGRPGAGMGYDFAGEVVETGKNVHLDIGNRVAGLIHGCHAANYSLGAFRQYLLADAALVIRIPDDLSFPRASTLGMGLSTAAQALYQVLRLPLPSEKSATVDKFMLIYGGSTATGCIAIQLAKLSGLKVITTCSTNNISRVSTLGADFVVDYKSPKAIKEIQKSVDGKGLALVLDCVANEKTASFCYQCFTIPQGQQADLREFVYGSLMPVQNTPPRPGFIPREIPIRNDWNMVYTCFGRRFTMVNDDWNIRHTWEASPEDRRFMETFYRVAEAILAQGMLQTMPIETGKGGLEGIIDGISLVREGMITGKKLVYELSH